MITTTVTSEHLVACAYYVVAADVILLMVYALILLKYGPEQIFSIIPGYPLVLIPLTILFYIHQDASCMANIAIVGFTTAGLLFALFEVMHEVG